MSKYSKIIVQKRCFVPTCDSSSTRNPAKDFFYLPKDNIEGWCRAAGYDGSMKHGLQICEDHLNLETDLENYMWWRTMGGHAKLKSEPPLLKNIEETSDKIKKQVTPMKTTITTIIEEPMSGADDDISPVSCSICKGNIFGLRYVCMQCENCYICGSCVTEAHRTHYLLRVPKNRPKDEVENILHNMRNLIIINNEKFLPTEYLPLSVNDNKPVYNEIDSSNIEHRNDEFASTTSHDLNNDNGVNCDDDDDNFYHEEDDVELLEQSGSDKTESERDARKRERLKDDCGNQVYLAPENLESQLINEYGGVLISKKRNMSPREIWLQHRGRQSQLDNEATEIFNKIVNKKIYQEMFKHGGKKSIVWKKIAQEMVNIGFDFGTRDPKTVCAQKWRNLEIKGKRQK